ncbi:FAD-dependent oxidoreductase [Actinomycetospora sp. TBRC 11914]|uniref:NAD(P)/FAD-dependent oxidoreductase n=1 Tax=Actinomycetospora sp. TBRC 11914 TaxID=2729387 RepID=UPI00145E2399|nr:FAD-dependent oxidoreductase [Actinomycetospora sp. TBRC 11914]NMO88522.1 FAD-dependent oxidoreductase [Actinomycetospora sp. TBRC 11914]
MRTVAVVGSSVAGTGAARALRRAGFDGRLVLVGDEAHAPYDRPPLSKGFLAGTLGEADLALLDPDDEADLALELHLGTRVDHLDPRAGRLGLADGRELAVDGVVVATGGRARRLPGTGDTADGDTVETRGVHVLRTLDDALALGAALRARPRVVVVGAGFLGAEVASTCRGLGCPVTLLDAAALPLAPVLGERVARCCAEQHADHGTDVRHGRSVAGLHTAPSGRGRRVTGVELDDATVVPADVVVVGVGITPNTEWLAGSGLRCRDGVRTDAGLMTDLPQVVAVGDVARHDVEGPAGTVGTSRHEHWTSAGEQADVAAANLLAGRTLVTFRPSGYFWSDQYGRMLQLAGRPGPGDRVEVVDGDLADRIFTARYLDGAGTTTAVLGLGSPRAFGRLRRAELGRVRQPA